MHYEFESANHIDDYLKAIKGTEEFFVKRDEEHGIQVINYLFNTPLTFPDTRGLSGDELRYAVLRRDCRGIKFDLAGNLITKPLHKFHNVGERPETMPNVIDWTQPHRILEKLDGSMITLYRGTDGYQTHTKMGCTDVAMPVHDYIKQHPNYLKLYEALREEDCTAVFEWCSRQQRIVISYMEEKLVLIAVRHNTSGRYMAYELMRFYGRFFGVPVVSALPGSVENIQKFMDETKEIEDAEGYVIRFDTGHMLKVKGEQYIRMHRTKSMLSEEKNVWDLVLSESYDDEKQMLAPTEISCIDAFSIELFAAARTTSQRLDNIVQMSKKLGYDKKTFAIEIVNKSNPKERSLLFKMWDGNHPFTVVLNFIRQQTSTRKKVDEIRELVNNIRWENFYSTGRITED